MKYWIILLCHEELWRLLHILFLSVFAKWRLLHIKTYKCMKRYMSGFFIVLFESKERHFVTIFLVLKLRKAWVLTTNYYIDEVHDVQTKE